MSDHKQNLAEVAQQLTHPTTVTTGVIGSVYSLWVDNPIGFICAMVAVGSFLMNWYYNHKRLKLQERQQEQGNQVE
ncbi:hypothetical protein [Microbulbifer sp. SAOS-129_SWC]|uniref:hypothetical protein n=1 Tax=Microbulbifer sp. SAOS-129_SWC TaxID=3145235 RepID=UPI0032173CA9